MRARDSLSPLAVRELLIRRRGRASWISLPTTPRRDGFSAFVDDERLARGVYQLRARAVDQAGNERTADNAGRNACPACPPPADSDAPRRRSSQAGPRPRRGQEAPISHRAYRAAANSIRTYDPAARPADQPRREPAGGQGGRGVRADESPRRGLASDRHSAHQPERTVHLQGAARPEPHTALPLRRHSDDPWPHRTRQTRRASVNDDSARLAAASSTARTSRSAAGSADDRSRRRGKLIELQARTRGGWRTLPTTRACARSGHWSYRYRFSATRGTVRYRFRASVPKETAFPFETGASRTVCGVQVRGL